MATVFKRGGRKSKGKYLFAYTNHRGVRQTRSARTTDLEAARRIAAKFEADAALRRDGVVDPRLETLGEQSRRTIEEHLADFKAKLSAAGASVDHLTRTCRFIRDAAEAGGCEAAGDITADKVNHYGAELLKKMAGRSVAARLTAIKSFTRWLAAEGKLRPIPWQASRSPAQRPTVAWSVECSCPTNGSGCGLSRWRTMPHAMECQRVSGCCSMLPQSKRGFGRTNCEADPWLFVLRRRPALYYVQGGVNQNRQDARQYINPELAAELRRHVATKAPGAVVFAMPRPEVVAAMLARLAWLKAAKHDPEERQRREQSDFLMPVNHEKEALDFHSLRHTCGAWLAQSGAHPKAVQAVMRHSVITLTMDTYGHLFPGQEADTVARLPNLLSNAQPKAMQATGTYDQKPQPAADAGAVRGAEGGNRRHTAKRGEPAQHGRDQEGDKSTFANLLPVPTLGKRRQEAAKAGNSGRDGTRTHTPANGDGILNPERLPFRHSA